MTGGGVNWGGAAFDPVNQILYANTSQRDPYRQTDPARGGRGISTRRPAMISDSSRARRLR